MSDENLAVISAYILETAAAFTGEVAPIQPANKNERSKRKTTATTNEVESATVTLTTTSGGRVTKKPSRLDS